MASGTPWEALTVTDLLRETEHLQASSRLLQASSMVARDRLPAGSLYCVINEQLNVGNTYKDSRCLTSIAPTQQPSAIVSATVASSLPWLGDLFTGKLRGAQTCYKRI